MGTIQSRGTPVERIELMGDHQRLEIDDVIEVRWNRNPPFKVDDPDAVHLPTMSIRLRGGRISRQPQMRIRRAIIRSWPTWFRRLAARRLLPRQFMMG